MNPPAHVTHYTGVLPDAKDKDSKKAGKSDAKDKDAKKAADPKAAGAGAAAASSDAKGVVLVADEKKTMLNAAAGAVTPVSEEKQLAIDGEGMSWSWGWRCLLCCWCGGSLACWMVWWIGR